MIMSYLSDYLRIRHEHASKNNHTNRTTRNLVKRQIDDGQFGNDNEYICHPIRQDQHSQERLFEFRQALKKGEASGKSRPLDMSAVKRTGRKLIKAAD